jgi:hypothetical protein
MTVPFRTFALFGLALGMLAAGYLFAPAPGATSPIPAQSAARAEPQAPAKALAPTLVANRPPVPLVTPPRPSSYTPPAEPSDKPATAEKAGAERTAALTADQPATKPGDQPSGDDAQARRAIEFDGYKGVRGLTKGPDGVWHGRALRGRAEVAVRVDANGNVSAE